MRAIVHTLLFNSYPTARRNPSNKRPVPFTVNKITMSSTSDQTPDFENPRMVLNKVLAKAQGEGAGAVVRRSIGRYKIDRLLLLLLFS